MRNTDTRLEAFLDMLNGIVKKAEISNEQDTGIRMPMYKKGDTKICANHRGILLTRNGVKKEYQKEVHRNFLKKIKRVTQHAFRKEGYTQNLTLVIRETECPR